MILSKVMVEKINGEKL